MNDEIKESGKEGINPIQSHSSSISEYPKAGKIESWLKDPWNIVFLAILILGIAIRIYYFNINTGIWWDELEYLATGKAYAGMLDYALAPERAVLFPLSIAVIFLLGGSELWIRILLELIPSIGILIGTYLLGRSLFDKKIGLLAMAIMAVFYEHLFDMSRILSDMQSNFFELFCILSFWHFYAKNKNPKLLFVSVILGFLGMMTRYPAALALVAIAAYIIITKKGAVFKDKNVWLAILAGIGCIGLYIVYNLITFGSPFPALMHYIFNPSTGTAAIAAEHSLFNFSFFQTIGDWFSWPLLIFFLIGLYMFVELFFVIDKVIKEKGIKENPNLLVFLWVGISAFFWIFIFHFTVSRWAMGIAPAVFIITAYGCIKAYNLIVFFASHLFESKFFAKFVAIALIAVLFVYGLNLEFSTADYLIKYKKDSYAPVKDISLWLKENTNESDSIIFDSRIWYTYYVGRNNSKPTSWWILPPNYDFKNMSYLLDEVAYGYVPMCEYDFDFTLNRTNQDYLVWSVFEQVYTANVQYLQKNIDNGVFVPVKQYTSGGQPIAIIFKIDKQKLNEKLSSNDYSNQLIPATVQETQTAWESYKKAKGITEEDLCGFK